MNKLSLFTGVMGDDLASMAAGIFTTCCVENDPFCQLVIKSHYPNMPIIGDIHDVTKAKYKELTQDDRVDIIAGGDPCQPRSIAGKRRGEEDDRDLWYEMFRIICEFKPTWVVNENPTGRLTMDFHKVLSDLESQGYETRSFCIPASAVKASHRRDRLFIVAYSDGNGQQLRRNTKRRGYVADKQIEIPATWNNACHSIGDWEKLFTEAGSAGRYDGIPSRLVRKAIKHYGNAVVPQQVYPIYKAIMRIETNQWG